MQFETLKTSFADGVLTVQLSNPAARNAVNGTMHDELPEFFRAVARREDVLVVVMTGDPEGRAFCAGGDLRWLAESTQTGESYARVLSSGLDIVRSILDLPLPLLAMVNGPAIGLGATLALLADVSFIDEATTIADPHVGIGVVAGDGGAAIWPLLIGPNRAKEFLMTGASVDGRRAEAMGLVNHAVPASELSGAVLALAAELASGPQLAIRMTKQSVNLGLRQAIEAIVPASIAMEGLTFNTADSRAAIARFLQLRG